MSTEAAGNPVRIGDTEVPDQQSTQRYLRRADAANYVRMTWGFPCSAKWLAKLAVVGGGPTYRKAGRFPIYTSVDLDTWAEARIGTPRRSTSVEV